jgi:hypothetical protein
LRSQGQVCIPSDVDFEIAMDFTAGLARCLS